MPDLALNLAPNLALTGPALLALIHNAALLLTLALVLDLSFHGAGERGSVPTRLLTGFLIGAIGSFIMLTPWPLVPGLFFDTRSVLLAVSGLFFGALPTLVAMAMTTALRLFQGGLGAPVGVAVILASGTIGILWRRWRPAPEGLPMLELYLLGVLVHVVMLALLLTVLPQPAATLVFERVGLAVLGVYPVTTLLLAALMANRLRRQQQESALYKERVLLGDTQEMARLGGWEYDVATGQRHWTAEVYRIFGLTPDYDPNDTERNIAFYVPDDRPRMATAFRRAVELGEPYDLELRHETAQGECRWVRTRGAAEVCDGRVVRVFGSLMDITDRRQAEQTLVLQARRATALLDLPRAAERLDERAFMEYGLELAEQLTGSRIGFIHLVDADQQTIEMAAWSQATREHYCRAVYDGHYPVGEAGVWAEALRRRAPVVLNDYAGALPVEVQRRGLPPGHAALARLISVPVLESGLVRMIAGLGNKPEPYTDLDVETLQLLANEVWRIVRQRRDESQLRKLAQAVEQSPESIVITNLAGQIEYVNEAFERATGYDRVAAIGQNPRILQSGKTPPSTYLAMWEALSQGRPWQGEFINRRRDGSEYTEQAIVAPLQQADGSITHYVAVKEDISEKQRVTQELDGYRHHLEELVTSRTQELTEARARAEAANQAKSVFLANMSHEIRTPMNAILGLTHLLLRNPVTPAQAGHLRGIDNAARHLLAIINAILDLSKIEAGRLELEQTDFDLVVVLDQVRSMVAEQAAAKGLALEMALETVPRWLRGDPTHLRQALLNCAANAVKFTEHGMVRLGARLLEESPDGLLIRFEVQDTGIGIAAEHLPRLFGAFEQVDSSTTRRYGGTGLGLAITRRLAQLMGGAAGAESTPGQGSIFWFTARLGHGQADPAGPDAETDTGVAVTIHQAEREFYRRHAGARLLLVEDNPINREMALELLRAAELQVDTAQDGQEAVAMAAAIPYDLILMDVQMPVMNGLDATRAIRRLPGHATTPILAVTANAFDEDREACLAAGMDDHLSKPVDPATLFAALLKWFSHDPPETFPPLTADGTPAAGDANDTERRRIVSLDAAVSPDLPAIKALVRRLEALLAIGDIAAGHLFRDSAAALQTVLGDSAVRLRRQIESFDYDQARATLSAIQWPDRAGPKDVSERDK